MLIQVIATAVSTWLADKTGRRILLTVSSAGMTLSLVVVAASFFVKGFVEDSSSLYSAMGILSVVGVVVAFLFSFKIQLYAEVLTLFYQLLQIGFSLGMGPIPWVIMSEILPVNIKGLAGSIANISQLVYCLVDYNDCTFAFNMEWNFHFLHANVCCYCRVCGRFGARNKGKDIGGDPVFPEIICFFFILVFCT
ncbi:hypothetical protein L1987_14038 [Smallanthus sonchifolius]|uniref:Uncharacterized protein n=1 Tax=Smallanthus sonchifolius TaxID=185202 RepID=A0ACB9JKA0_9ASTR|nr:hypothetical protein L1987_14038 [Smallanthus sonchifolius]